MSGSHRARIALQLRIWAIGRVRRDPLRWLAGLLIRSAKADYVHPLSKQTRLEAGWKSSYVTTINDMRFATRVNGGWQPDLQRTNRFVYDETIHAGYVNGQHD